MKLFSTLMSASALALALGGCAGIHNLSTEVSTFGAWPADRKPASFAFDRLPSQEPASVHQSQLETSARGALESIGFSAAGDPSQAEYRVQVGARVTTNDPWVYNAPLFWDARFGGWGGWGRRGRFAGYGAGWGPGWGSGWGWGGGPYGSASFDHEVVLVIRDRRSGDVLYEARADNAGLSPQIDRLLPAMFGAALHDFPRVDPKPRTVLTPLSQG